MKQFRLVGIPTVCPVILLILLFLPGQQSAVLAQAVDAGIVGTVTDQSGATIPGASVTAVNTGTGQSRTAITNERGDYEIRQLDIGYYDLTVEMPGFKTSHTQRIRLNVNQINRQNVSLEIGEISQDVTVNANVVALQTDDSTVSTVVNEAQIRELPIPANRNLFRLSLLAPGMSAGPPSSVTTGGFGAGFGVAAMGQKVHNNAIYLDGAPLKTAIHGIVRMRPSVEAIQEFRVQAGWYSAEFGAQSGAHIIATIRPGTNEYHGTLFHFVRNEIFDARNFFENPNVDKNPLRRNTFGGVVSGPIVANKAFFTVNAELLRERRTNQSFAVFPTTRMKNGDLTEPFFRNPDGSLKPITDPATGQPFANNQIPSNRISPIAKNFFKFWPQPNFGAAQFDGKSNYATPTKDELDDDQLFVRIDYNINDRNKLFGRYGYQNATPLDKGILAFAIDERFINFNPRITHNTTLNYTHLFSTSMLNEVRVSHNYDIFRRKTGFTGSNFDIARELGIPGQTTVPEDTGPSSVSIANCCSVGVSDPNTIWDEARQISDNFSFVRGSHTIKLGSEFTHLRTDRRTVSFVRGDFFFNGQHSGNSWADFLLDQPQRIRLGFKPGSENAGTFPNFRYWRWHSYFANDWKISPNLTMNYGLRWEYNSVFKDVRGQSRNFDYARKVLFPAVGEVAALNEPDYNNFAPRIGFAWRPFGGVNTVIRLGYGVFYNVNMINNFVPILAANPPNTLRIEETNAPGRVVLRMANADQASRLLVASSLSAAAVEPTVGDVQQWSLNVQQMLPHQMLLEVGYTGSRSAHFDMPRETNMFIPGTKTRPIPEFSSIELHDSNAWGNYHGLLMKLERQFARGVTFLQTYTWSKNFFTSFACCGAERPNNPYDYNSAEKGLAEVDIEHRTTTAWLWELPWASDLQGPARHIVSGWQLNGVLVMETGLPIHPTQSLAPVDDGCPRCTRRPDRLGDGNLDRGQRSVDRWFDTSAFAIARGRYGNTGRSILRAPGNINLDFSLFKNFPIDENKRIQFRWEMYNATNTPHFNEPVLNIQSGDFGRIRSAQPGREMQFGLRFEF